MDFTFGLHKLTSCNFAMIHNLSTEKRETQCHGEIFSFSFPYIWSKHTVLTQRLSSCWVLGILTIAVGLSIHRNIRLPSNRIVEKRNTIQWNTVSFQVWQVAIYKLLCNNNWQDILQFPVFPIPMKQLSTCALIKTKHWCLGAVCFREIQA